MTADLEYIKVLTDKLNISLREIPNSVFGSSTIGYVIEGGKLTKLNLYNLGLEEIPEYLYKFDYLEEIHLSFNNISVLPKRIRELKYLKHVNLAKNKRAQTRLSLKLPMSTPFAG